MVKNMIHCTVVMNLCLLVTKGVFGVDTDGLKSVSVMEGDSVTLHTDLTEIQRDYHILWRFGPENPDTVIAEIIKRADLTRIYEYDGRFKDSLQLNNQTGSLTIRNIRITHSGLYKLTVSNGKVFYTSFRIICAPSTLPVPIITGVSSQCSSSSESSSKCVLLCSVVNVTHVTLSWYKGNSLLSSISVSDLNSSLSLPLEVEYQENNIYSCVINNPIRNQTKHLDINEVCQMCSDTRLHIFLSIVAIIIVLLFTALVWRICVSKKHKISKQEAQTQEEEIHYSTITFCPQSLQHEKSDEADNIVYSRIVT
ncbi:hepatocyte cell adhesion molecule-like isoform X1 [Xyrauchen texanus]|uniref:hepatocyte cell adhesion molecule-like isoform X1 n=1 Tax=Xyrauchen texanus TaxID=154827 RepID=UPI002242AC7A|nr:hepatocyte cell adhesion molecule-like isoform X1 [Xyrauchen texanus]XP_051977638.1 hepatocyte cell adhesion molecule-like isoform X1 [Xyrauchen texanus]